ncbi:ankyrin repeat-containing protein BDA1-like [Actinidia eriantha]|uniref:ankyrin repeat-containing protein BDA1-like n=1 Tax=Actinidia eriantha TaxID=165200 RepID=UPI002583855B|nr:ankyrin repeat-containing protein BDA1-like [Actinidia eriantha]
MSIQTMEEAQTILRVAAEAGDINGLYNSIKEVPNILDHIEETPFVDSPMHIAASSGHANFAIEIFSLKPSFGRKLNPDGLSPLHLAFQNGHFETVRRVIKFDKELVRVKGRERLTLLHFAAKTGNADMLGELLYVCPESILDLTVQDETSLHIAVKNMKLSALEVLLGFLGRTRNKWLLKGKDEIGNTVLHIAVATSQPQMVELLLKNDPANKNEKNWKGDTTLDIAMGLHPGDAKTTINNILRGAGVSQSSSLAHDHNFSFADFLKSRDKFPEIVFRLIFQMRRNLSMGMRNIVLVVAVLIATATFQAVLSPPGGVGGGSDNILPNGTLINATMSSTNLIPFSNISHVNATILLPSDNPFNRILIKNYHGKDITYGSMFFNFYFLNTIAFLASVTMIILVLPVQGSLALHISLLFLMLSYGISFIFISPSYRYAKGFMLLSFIYAGVVYCLIGIKVLYNKFPASHLHLKRIWMLHWLLMNSSDYSTKVRP